MHEHKNEQKKNFEEMIRLINNSHNQLSAVISENFKFQHGSNQFRFVEGILRGLIDTDESYIHNDKMKLYLRVLRNIFTQGIVTNEVKYNATTMYIHTVIFESVRTFSKDNKLIIMEFMEKYNGKIDGFSDKSYRIEIVTEKYIHDELKAFIDTLELKTAIGVKIIVREHIAIKNYVLSDRYKIHIVRIDGTWK